MRPTLSVYLVGAAVLTAGAVLVRLLRPSVQVIGRGDSWSGANGLVAKTSDWESLPQRLRERGLQ